MTEPVQLIRDALAAFESADSYREDKEAVCNFHDALTRTTVIALLARLDAAEKDAARWNHVLENASSYFDVYENIQLVVQALPRDLGWKDKVNKTIDATMKGKP